MGVVPLELPTTTSWFPPLGVSTGLGAVDCPSWAAELKGRIEQQTVGKEELKTLMAVLIGRRCRWGFACVNVSEQQQAFTQASKSCLQDSIACVAAAIWDRSN